MLHKRFTLSVVFFFGFGLIGIHAQEIHQTISTSGGEASGIGGSISYSVGQIVYTANTGTNGSESQGVQQPYEISVVTGLEESAGINLILSAFPNPTSNVLQLKIENYNKENMFYEIYDFNGKLLETKKIDSNITNIVMVNFVSSNYFLKIKNNNELVKTFKITKN